MLLEASKTNTLVHGDQTEPPLIEYCDSHCEQISMSTFLDKNMEHPLFESESVAALTQCTRSQTAGDRPSSDDIE